MDIFEKNKKTEPKSYEVTFLPMGKEVRISPGDNLLSAARLANVPLIADCGGLGTCGKCKVKLDSGKIKSEEFFILSDEETKKGYILACKSYPDSDVVVSVPASSVPSGIKSAGEELGMFDISGMPYEKKPLVEKIYLECKAPSGDENTNFLDVVYRHLKEKTEIENFHISHKLLKKLPGLLGRSDWKITVTLRTDLCPAEIMSIEEGDTSRKNYGIVIDVGTTVVEGILVEVSTGELLRYTSSLNPQVKYGEDLGSRMNFALSEERGILILSDIILDRINEILLELVYESGISRHHVYSLLITGNTVMIHLLLGLDLKYIQKAPSMPVALEFPVLKARELNLYAHSEAPIYIPPAIGTYVGADVVCSLISTGMPDEDFLLIDLGTNGEVAAVVEGAVTCASTSAGPAFEGGGIKCGMRAADGAVNRVHYSNTHQDFILTTVGDKPPRGISGSGLIDLLANLLLHDYIDKKGNFRSRHKTSRIRTVNGLEEFVLAVSPEDGEVISITEEDIDYLIKSKGAVYTGFNFLLEKIGKPLSEIQKFYIAGSLGRMINIENGVVIGLLPDVDRDKFKFIGNGSLFGGLVLLNSAQAREKAAQIARSAAYFELSDEPEYMNKYTSSLFLPHTDLDKFPSVMEKLKSAR